MPRGPAPDHLGPDEAARLVFDHVGQLAALRHPGRRPPRLSDATHLEADLGFDSLTVAELLVRVEAASGRRLPERVLAEAGTVADLVAAVTQEASRAARHPGGAGPRSARRPAGDASPDGPRDAGELLAGRPGDGGEPLSGRPRDGDPPVAPHRGPTPYGIHARFVFALVGVVGWLLVAIVPGAARRWRIVRSCGRLLLTVTGIRFRVVGRDRLPPQGAYVVAANHASFLDPLLLAMVLPVPVTFTAVEGLQERAAARWFLRRLHVELVPRFGDRRRRVASAQVLTRQAALGRRLVFFPEGRRSPTAGVEPFRMGAFVVATQAGVPVVPISIRGTRDILPVDAGWPRRGEITVEIGPAVHAPTAGFEPAVQLQQRVRDWIVASCREPDLRPF